MEMPLLRRRNKILVDYQSLRVQNAYAPQKRPKVSPSLTKYLYCVVQLDNS